MHRPEPADLLAGVADVLRESVLVELDDGAARRQLKAALQIVERVGRSTDRLPAYLVEDAGDVLRTLAALELNDAALRDRIDAAGVEHERIVRAGWGAPVPELRAVHETLQRCVIDAERWASAGTSPARTAAGVALRALYLRMLRREALAWGLPGAETP